MASERMIASNGKNARKSCGPKTVEGKNVVRQNALKHGLTARTLVVLGECEDDFQAMADRHLAVFQPRNDVELEFCKTFTFAAWRRHRCVTAEAGITNERIRSTQLDEETAAQNTALALCERLFHDRKGIWQCYLDPLAKYRPNYREQSGPPGPVEAPAQIVAELESTLEGCRFLLERWRELSTYLNCQRGWRALDMFMCMRLVGKEPLDVLDEPPGELMDIFLACHKIDGSDKGPFDELRCVVSDLDLAMILKRLKRMGYEARKPVSEDHARSILNNLVDRNISRLEALFQAQEARALLNSAERARRLMFDPSDDADKSRRYGDICVRQMTRACEELTKIRRSGFGDESGESQPWAESELDEPGSIPADVGLSAPSSVRAEDVAGETESRALTGGANGSPPSVTARCPEGEPPCEPHLAGSLVSNHLFSQAPNGATGSRCQAAIRETTSGRDCLRHTVAPSELGLQGINRGLRPTTAGLGLTPPGYDLPPPSRLEPVRRALLPALNARQIPPVIDRPVCRNSTTFSSAHPCPSLSSGGTRDRSPGSAPALDSRLFLYALLLFLGLWRSLLGAVAARMRVDGCALLTARTAVSRLVQALSTLLAVSQNKPVAICAGRARGIRRLMMAAPP
jgi:hypothetical protein